MRLGDLGEFELIDLIAHHQPPAHGRLLKGIGDDCAVIDTSGSQVSLITTDTMVEGVHFDLATSTPEGLGAKLLAVNVSDIAAMGGMPHEVFLAISASPGFDATVIERTVGGLQASGSRFGVQLAGGDTTSTDGPLVLTLTALGTCPKDEVVYRSGAQVGDSVFVTGTPGESAGGLGIVRDGVEVPAPHRERLLRRLHRPEPRVSAARYLASGRIASSMIDVSDGLAGDLRHICHQSGVDIVIDPSALPISPAVEAYCDAIRQDPVDCVLQGGEDYELAFTSSSSDFPSEWGSECRLSYIGTVTKGDGEVRVGTVEKSQVYDKKGFEHFPVTSQ
jgi:thiamine-monophosphate kinase